MTDEAFATVAGHRATKAKLNVSNIGPWFLEVDFEDAPELAGRVTAKLGTLQLSGTVVTVNDGTFASQRRTRIVGGAAAWGKIVAPKDYHNDAGVKASLIAGDVARSIGETLGTFVPASERVGADFVRSATPASVVLEAAAGKEVAWWVDYAGVTHAGPRPATSLDSSLYEVLAFDPRNRVATLSIDDVASLSIGATIAERLDAPQVIRDFEVTVSSNELRATVWCGGSASEAGRLAALMRAISQRSTNGKLLAHYRYRVVSMASDGRCALQAVRKAAGLPDIQPIAQWPGVAGVHAELTPGAEVLVAFIEGNPAMPIVTHYAGKSGVGFVPVSLVIGGTTGPAAARQGDAVEVLLPPAIFSGTIGGSPATGVLTFPMSKTEGSITAGSGKVKIAT